MESAERDAQPELVQDTLQRFLIRFGRFAPLNTLAYGVPLSCGRSNEVLGRTYGRDNRVLHTAKVSQDFKMGPPIRTWQGTCVSTGGAKIGVTDPENDPGPEGVASPSAGWFWARTPSHEVITRSRMMAESHAATKVVDDEIRESLRRESRCLHSMLCA
jgi:hypothetical protein